MGTGFEKRSRDQGIATALFRERVANLNDVFWHARDLNSRGLKPPCRFDPHFGDWQGRHRAKIAEALGCIELLLTKLLKLAARLHSEPFLDGRISAITNYA
jgi:hypothetical protein